MKSTVRGLTALAPMAGGVLAVPYGNGTAYFKAYAAEAAQAVKTIKPGAPDGAAVIRMMLIRIVQGLSRTVMVTRRRSPTTSSVII